MITLSSAIQNKQDIRDQISYYQSEDDSEAQFKETETKADAILALSNNLLISDTLFGQHKNFAIDMIKQLQSEYDCKTISEKSVAEVAVLSFIRILELKQLMKESLIFQQNLAASHTCGEHSRNWNSINHNYVYGCCACNRAKIETQKYALLSKELDRANRHYLSAIQTLRMMKQTPLQVTVKAGTALIGNQQLIQNNHEI